MLGLGPANGAPGLPGGAVYPVGNSMCGSGAQKRGVVWEQEFTMSLLALGR